MNEVYGMPPLVRRGEVWWVNFNPAVGMEIQKIRPAVIVSSDALNAYEVRLVVPITSWSASYTLMPWIVQILPTPDNGLEKPSAANLSMTRSVAVNVRRFQAKIGVLEPDTLVEVVAALALITEYQSA
jgi:mRNA interferase MazF